MRDPVRPLIRLGKPPVTGEIAHRVVVIEGRKVGVFDRHPPLPQRLDGLLAMPGMRRFPIRITGWRAPCSEQDHRLLPFAEGSVRCLDGERRSLRLLMCADCESVCVRDNSLDWLPGLTPGRWGWRRRDKIIGWYSGARRNQREYR